MAKKAGIVLGTVGVVLGALVVFIASRPADFRVERTARIDAPADTAFSLVNDFHQWGQWSPYDKLDPSMKKTFEGPASGVGAAYGWAGNGKAGEGRMTILESKPAEKIDIKLEFSKPFTATNRATFSFTPVEGGTQVTWAMQGQKNFVSKAFSLVMDMDKLVGKDFEQGLVNMNAAAQAENKAKQAKSTSPASDARPTATP